MEGKGGFWLHASSPAISEKIQSYIAFFPANNLFTSVWWSRASKHPLWSHFPCFCRSKSFYFTLCQHPLYEKMIPLSNIHARKSCWAVSHTFFSLPAGVRYQRAMLLSCRRSLGRNLALHPQGAKITPPVFRFHLQHLRTRIRFTERKISDSLEWSLWQLQF